MLFYLKPISNEEDMFKYFMTFNITPHELVFRVVVGSQITVPLTYTNISLYYFGFFIFIFFEI